MQLSVFDGIRIGVLIVLLGTALYTDLRFGKIYNKLTLPCILLGVSLNFAGSGVTGLLQSLAGAGLVLVLFLLFGSIGKIGGGDVKLMMAVGSLIGIKLGVWALLFAAISGGVMALVVMLRYKTMLATTKNMAPNVYMKAAFGAPVDLSSGSKGIKFRYSPAIALGTLLAFVFRG